MKLTRKFGDIWWEFNIMNNKRTATKSRVKTMQKIKIITRNRYQSAHRWNGTCDKKGKWVWVNRTCCMNPLIMSRKKYFFKIRIIAIAISTNFQALVLSRVQKIEHTIARRSGINPDRPFSMSGTLVPRKTKLMSAIVATASWFWSYVNLQNESHMNLW